MKRCFIPTFNTYLFQVTIHLTGRSQPIKRSLSTIRQSEHSYWQCPCFLTGTPMPYKYSTFNYIPNHESTNSDNYFFFFITRQLPFPFRLSVCPVVYFSREWNVQILISMFFRHIYLCNFQLKKRVLRKHITL